MLDTTPGGWNLYYLEPGVGEKVPDTPSKRLSACGFRRTPTHHKHHQLRSQTSLVQKAPEIITDLGASFGVSSWFVSGSGGILARIF